MNEYKFYVLLKTHKILKLIYNSTTFIMTNLTKFIYFVTQVLTFFSLVNNNFKKHTHLHVDVIYVFLTVLFDLKKYTRIYPKLFVRCAT